MQYTLLFNNQLRDFSGHTHDYLYWEFHELNGREALRSGKWKLIRQPIVGETILELYDLSNDIHEDTNLAEKYPDKVKELQS